MQFYWLSPILIFPLWWNWKAGLAWWTIVFSTLTGIMGWVTKACTKAPNSVMGKFLFFRSDQHAVKLQTAYFIWLEV